MLVLEAHDAVAALGVVAHRAKNVTVAPQSG